MTLPALYQIYSSIPETAFTSSPMTMEQVSVGAAHVRLDRCGVGGDQREATDRCEPQVKTGTCCNGQPSTSLDPRKQDPQMQRGGV